MLRCPLIDYILKCIQILVVLTVQKKKFATVQIFAAPRSVDEFLMKKKRIGHIISWHVIIFLESTVMMNFFLL